MVLITLDQLADGEEILLADRIQMLAKKTIQDDFLSFLTPHIFLLPDTSSFDQDEMVNSDEKNEELETSPPSDNDTLFNADNKKKEQKQNLKRIILSMIAFSVVS